MGSLGRRFGALAKAACFSRLSFFASSAFARAAGSSVEMMLPSLSATVVVVVTVPSLSLIVTMVVVMPLLSVLTFVVIFLPSLTVVVVDVLDPARAKLAKDRRTTVMTTLNARIVFIGPSPLHRSRYAPTWERLAIREGF